MSDRAKVACINWTYPDAPKALSYILADGEMFAEKFHDTWPDAVTRSRMLAGVIKKTNGFIPSLHANQAEELS